MAVTIVDRRTTLDDAEVVTDWTNVGYGTVSGDVAEATNAVAESIAIGDESQYYTMPAGNIDLSSTLVYVYSFNNALQNAWDNTIPPNALLIGDGTNRVAFHMAGADKRVFNHLDGPTNWQCLVLDGDQADEMDTAGHSYADAGSFASLNLAQVTQVGTYHETLSKALGGGYNVATDIIRYGNDGIYVQGGIVSGSAGTCSEIAVADRSTVDGAAHGIFRELQPVAFGCQGPLTFADITDTTNDQYFEDSGVTIVFEDRNISDDKYYFNIGGNSSQTQSFILRNSSIVAAGPSVSLYASASIDVMIFDRVQFIDWRGALIFPTDSASYIHSVTNCGFNNCDKIDVGTIDFDDNSIINSAAASGSVEIGYDATALNMVVSGYEGTAGTAALLWSANVDPDGNLDGGSFTKGTAATHAIEFGILSPWTMTLRDITTSGYNASDDQDDSTFYFKRTSGSITVNIIGGTGNFSYKSDGASASIVISPVTLAINVSDIDTGNPIENARVFAQVTDGANFPYLASVGITGSGTTATVDHSTHGLSSGDWVVIRGANEDVYNGSYEITVTDSDTYTYTTNETIGSSPATGTITSTMVIINELTNASGSVIDTRSYGNDQAISGWVRKATASPLYIQGPISDIVDSEFGKDINIQLIPDE